MACANADIQAHFAVALRFLFPHQLSDYSPISHLSPVAELQLLYLTKSINKIIY